MWFTKTVGLALLLFSAFMLSGQIAHWVFKYTGCIYTSSAVFGVSMITSVLVLVLTGLLEIILPWLGL